jgi:hypothetical protein
MRFFKDLYGFVNAITYSHWGEGCVWIVKGYQEVRSIGCTGYILTECETCDRQF